MAPCNAYLITGISVFREWIGLIISFEIIETFGVSHKNLLRISPEKPEHH